MLNNICEESLSKISEVLNAGEYTLLGYNCFDDAYIQHMKIINVEIKPYGSFEETMYITYIDARTGRENVLVIFPYDKFVIWKDYVDISSLTGKMMNILGMTYFKDTPPNPEEIMMSLANKEPVVYKH